MIALDSSSLIAYLSGDRGDDVEAVETALRRKYAALPPVVLCELLSDPKLPDTVASLVLQLPLLSPADGHWERAGRLRSRLLARGRKAPLADTLIAQTCLDHDVPLVTRDTDFAPFAKLAGLKLA